MTRARLTDPFYRPCIVCDVEVGIEVGYEVGSAPDGVHRNVLAHESEIAEMKCDHRADMLMWLSTDEGYRWCVERLDEYPGPARRPE